MMSICGRAMSKSITFGKLKDTHALTHEIVIFCCCKIFEIQLVKAKQQSASRMLP